MAIKIFPRETVLKNQILDWLKFNGFFCWLTNTMGNYNPKTNSYYKNIRLLSGVADIIGILDGGRFFAIEVKTGRNKQTEAQKEFERKVKEKGGIYLLVYDLDTVIDFFEKEKKWGG